MQSLSRVSPVTPLATVFCLLIGLGLAFATGCGRGAGKPLDELSEEEQENLSMMELGLSGSKLKRARTEGPWTEFPNPFGNESPHPAAGIGGRVKAIATTRNETWVELRVENVAHGRAFGAHVHKLPCVEALGGGHYQDRVAPSTPTDPAYANDRNEIWLDFETDEEGEGRTAAGVHFVIRENGARSIVIHNQRTDIANGTAGPKLACIDVAF